jgi:site-specific DNA-methyltransferase (adenine-specific)
MNNLELNKIYCESNLETMARMPNNFIDLTVTSPPYDDLRDYNGYSFPFEDIAKELYRVTKNGGVIVWIVGDATINGSETGTSFKQALFFKECGFNLHDTMIYQKNSFPFPPSNRYFGVFEYMFVLSKGNPKTTNLKRVKTSGEIKKSTGARQKDGSIQLHKYETGKDTRIKENVWVYECGYGKTTTDKNAFKHPAMFPEKLVSDHIYTWSNEDDLVYDCFMGSGTTAKMAHIYKRNWIGSELSQEYVDLANKRLEPYLTQQTLF